MAKYCDKRDYRKIDIYVGGNYRASTTWAKNCKEAVDKYVESYPYYFFPGEVKAYMAEVSK